MAEALLRAQAGDRVEVLSAGSEPTRVNPLTLRVLQDEGLDISSLHAKSVNELITERFDYVITLCAEEVCPVFPNAVTRLHWELRDPAAVEGTEQEKLLAFRQTLSELKERLAQFLAAHPASA